MIVKKDVSLRVWEEEDRYTGGHNFSTDTISLWDIIV